MMRSHFLLAGLLCVACATPDAGHAAAEDDLGISLSRDGYGTLPILGVTITNRSSNAICVPRETLDNPNSYYMQLRLYDANGDAVPLLQEGGFVPPPMEGVIRIAPGGSERGRYYLDGRFRIPGGGTPFPQGMSAQVSFSYGPCENVWARQATSTRQPL